jgi:hypothetical protein
MFYAQSSYAFSGIVSESESQIIAEGPLFREGVFNGGLQEFSDFEKDVSGLKGVKFIRGEHPTDEAGNLRPIQPGDPVIGEILDAWPLPEKKMIWAKWGLDPKLLTQAELENIRAGKPVGTSPGFFCDETKLGSPQIYIPTGEIYSHIMKGPRRWDHIASPKKPACRKCGINHAQSQQNLHTGGSTLTGAEGDPGGQLKQPDFDIDHGKFVVQGVWSDDELKEMVTKVLALDPMQVDDRSAMRKLLVQILAGLDAAPIRIQSKQEDQMDKEQIKLLVQSEEFKEVVATAAAEKTAEALKDPLAALETAKTTIAEQAKTIDELKADKAAREEEKKNLEAEVVASREKSLFEQFKSWLKPGKAGEADKLWETAKTNPWQFRFENPKMFVAQSELPTRFTPAGNKTAGSEGSEEIITRADGIKVHSDSGDIAWGAMNIKTPEKLAEELGLPFPKADAGGK